MILVDTSVWVDHLQKGNDRLAALLDASEVLVHPFIIGEIALGHLQARATVLGTIAKIPHVVAASNAEVLYLIDRHSLFGLGIGYVDAHLLAAVLLTPGTSLWTEDKRLENVAARLGLTIGRI